MRRSLPQWNNKRRKTHVSQSLTENNGTSFYFILTFHCLLGFKCYIIIAMQCVVSILKTEQIRCLFLVTRDFQYTLV